jgi:hypothetical protein
MTTRRPDERIRELAYRIWGTCPGVPGEVPESYLENADGNVPLKVPDPPEDEAPRVEPETPKVGSRDAPGG